MRQLCLWSMAMACGCAGAPPQARPRVAVLPFANHSAHAVRNLGAVAADVLREGLVERGVVVMDRSEATRAGSDAQLLDRVVEEAADAARVGAKLGCTYVAYGSIAVFTVSRDRARPASGQVRVNCELQFTLVDVRSGEIVFARPGRGMRTVDEGALPVPDPERPPLSGGPLERWMFHAAVARVRDDLVAAIR